MNWRLFWGARVPHLGPTLSFKGPCFLTVLKVTLAAFAKCCESHWGQKEGI